MIASQAGWIVAELGRQPWAIQDMLPVGAATSNLAKGNVMTTFWMFAILFTLLLLAEIKIMLNQIKKGPEGV
jgi:cytochrome d ubiquinol oxidase subunit I